MKANATDLPPPAPVSAPAEAESIITPDGSAIVCPATQITYVNQDGPQYSTGFAEFSAATGRVARILGHWPTGQVTGPQVMDVQ